MGQLTRCWAVPLLQQWHVFLLVFVLPLLLLSVRLWRCQTTPTRSCRVGRTARCGGSTCAQKPAAPKKTVKMYGDSWDSYLFIFTEHSLYSSSGLWRNKLMICCRKTSESFRWALLPLEHFSKLFSWFQSKLLWLCIFSYFLFQIRTCDPKSVDHFTRLSPPPLFLTLKLLELICDKVKNKTTNSFRTESPGQFRGVIPWF